MHFIQFFPVVERRTAIFGGARMGVGLKPTLTLLAQVLAARRGEAFDGLTE